MKDDIETLRGFILGVCGPTEAGKVLGGSALAALDRLEARIAELEKEHNEAKRIEHQTFMDAASINVENGSLRAKLERAKEVLDVSKIAMEQIEKIAFEIPPPNAFTPRITYAAIALKNRITHVLAELSADAPAEREPSIAAMQEAMKEAMGGSDADE